jgi:hypothetical protein
MTYPSLLFSLGVGVRASSNLKVLRTRTDTARHLKSGRTRTRTDVRTPVPLDP